MTEKSEAPVGEMSECSIASLIEAQIARTYDGVRMQTAWENILNGSTSPKVIARALVRVLSQGDYERRRPIHPLAINVYLSCSSDPAQMGVELAKDLRGRP